MNCVLRIKNGRLSVVSNLKTDCRALTCSRTFKFNDNNVLVEQNRPVAAAANSFALLQPKVLGCGLESERKSDFPQVKRVEWVHLLQVLGPLHCVMSE